MIFYLNVMTYTMKIEKYPSCFFIDFFKISWQKKLSAYAIDATEWGYAMSKTLSLKLKDEIFRDTEDIIGEIHKPRNAYINDAVDYYNKFIKRKILKGQLLEESLMVSASSMAVLQELELLEDETPEW